MLLNWRLPEPMTRHRPSGSGTPSTTVTQQQEHFAQLSVLSNTPEQHICCSFQARIKWEGCGKKGIRQKNGGEDGVSLISPDGVSPSRMVGVSASVIFSCAIKSRRRFLLAQAHPGSPGKRSRKTVVCVCVCVCVSNEPRTASCQISFFQLF